MVNLPILYSGYIIILFSIIGFGYISSKILSSRLSVGELGLNGILFMTILSYLTNFLITHNYVHNSIFLIIGLLGFFFLLKKNYLGKK